DLVLRQVFMAKEKICHSLCRLEKTLITRLAVYHRKSIYPPTLASRPSRIVSKTLIGFTAFHGSRLGVVCHDMVRAVIWTYMVFHSGLCVSDCNILETIVSGSFRSKK